MRLLSDIQMMDSDISQGQEDMEAIEPPTPEGAEAIKSMLNDFGRELDESLMDMNDEKYPALDEEQDSLTRRALSSDYYYDLSSQETKLLQLNLHQLRKENSVLKENNDQFLSEIEQTTEEHESEMKLYDERTKQKISELKVMYQEEIDALIQEKDAAIAEAGRQAARYADSGRKQIATLKKQITKLNHHMKEALQKAVDDAATRTKRQKEQEITSRLLALRTSYESKLEKLKAESEEKIKFAVSDAVANVTKQMTEGRKSPGLDEETSNLVSKRTLEQLVGNEEAMVKALQSVKENITKHYPKVKDLQERSYPSPLVLFRRRQDGTSSEKLFEEVVEAFAFLLDRAESRAVPNEKSVERNEMYAEVKQELMEKHRLELEHVRSKAETAHYQSKDDELKIERLEQELKIMTREKRLIQERFRRDAESHQIELQKLKSRIEQLEGGLMPAKPKDNLSTRRRRDVAEIRREIAQNSDDFSLDLKLAISESCDEVECLRSPSESPLQGLGIHPEPLQLEGPGQQAKGDDSSESSYHPRSTGSETSDNLDMASVRKSIEYPSEDGDSEDKTSGHHKQEPFTADAEPKKKKSFAILRGFKPSRGITPSVENTNLDQETGENVEDSNHSQRSKSRTASRIRNLRDSRARADSSHDRQNSFSDESVSSLRTYTGGDSTPQSQSVRSSRTVNDAASAGDQNAQSSTPGSDAEPTTFRKKKNPLGMFANRRKQSLSPEKALASDHDEIPQALATTNYKDGESLDIVDEAGTAREGVASETEPTRQHKAPLPGFDSLKNSRKEKSTSRVVDGRKAPLPEWTADNETVKTGETSQLSSGYVGVPSAIDVQRNSSKAHLTRDTEVGHTMCLRPLPVESKSHSNTVPHSTEDNHNTFLHSLRNSSQDLRSDEYSSQAQMRKLPPLGDQSDDESRDESVDKYHTSDRAESNIAPGIFSRRSFEDGSPSVHLNSSASKPVVVQGQSISRKAKLQAIARKKDIDTASEATTAITAHTFRSSFSTEPSKLRDLVLTSQGGSAKRAIATLKARRARRVAEF
jgi:hypothetical protein